MGKNSKNIYLYLLMFHTLIGALIFFMPVFSKIYSLSIVFIGYYIVIKNKNANNEVLVVSAYIVGVEVLLRMTDGFFINEYGKYNIIALMLLGIKYSGSYKGSYLYMVFLLFLIPGVLYGMYTLNFESNIRKAIAFNISGPVCLGLSAIFCFNRLVTIKQIKNIILSFGMPILSIVIYLILYTPDLRSVITNTSSNHSTSGGFGPNQVSTILGFGIFIFFTIFYIFSYTKRDKIATVIVLVLVSFRGLITFSRGGVYVGLIMIFLLLIMSFFHLSIYGKLKVFLMVLTGMFLVTSIWSYSSYTTGGLIDKRYANQDAAGRVKKSKLTGRETLIESELVMFYENPIIGIGVGKNKEYREQSTGIESASHNEISRMLAEHGLLGVINLLILIITPLILLFANKQNIFMLSFYIFWFLTINHAAMRLAAPAFIYALSLLKVTFADETKTPLHRQQTL